ncbi:MAG TPA: MFS transporter [Thermohalobaculum sp.]|nr:MFS transporter [Thermohalobaculum sp.]
MRTLISFAALFVSILLVQLGSGTLGPLDALAGAMRGFTTEEIGILGSAHFVGFLAGCYLTPRYIGSIGHSRAFAAAAAVGAIGALLHPVLEGPWLWAGLRLLTGLAISSAYTVIESWLQAKAENRNRARVYGVFRVVDLTGQITAQGLIAVLDPATYWAYNVVAVFCCLCILPLALTRQVAPKTPLAPRLRPVKAARLSPSATVGIIVAGMTGASFRMIGPVFGLENGLEQTEIALFLSAAVLGGAAAQFPVGWAADAVDRRLVLIGLSVLAIMGCVWTVIAVQPGATGPIFLAAFLFGATTYPIYSVSAAYANDYAEPDFIVELNAALIFFYSLGAIVAPLAAARLVSLFGPPALFAFASVAHLALIAFTLYRITRRRTTAPVAPYRYLPRTSMILARLLGRTNGNAGEAVGPRDPQRREP